MRNHFKALPGILAAGLFAGGLLAAQHASAMPQSSGQKAHEGFSGAGVSITYPTPQANNYQLFQPKIGFQGELWYGMESLLGPNLEIHGSVGFQPYGVKSMDTARITQITFFIGVETRAKSFPGFIKPFASLELGGAYSSLSFTNATNTNQNAAANFALRARPGFLVELMDDFSLGAQMPIDYIIGRNRFAVLSAAFSLRYDL